MSRPEKPIDWDKVDELLMAGCLGTEIAANYDMHPNTFYDRVVQKYNMSFTDYCSEKRSKGESFLRLVQFKKAVEGDNSMLIWLGKNRLKQSDSPQEQASNEEMFKQLTSLMEQINALQSSPRSNAYNSNNIE
jgi:hypothetical protein